MDVLTTLKNRVGFGSRPAESDEFGNTLFAKGMLDYAELTRRGNGWTIITETAFDPVAAVPTTVAELEVYNNTTDQVLIVADLFAFQLLSTAATQTYSIWAMVTTQKAVPTLAALEMYSLSGRQPITPTANGAVVPGAGTTVVANGWRPYGNVQAWGTAAATPGNGWSADINGKLLVPPKCSLAVAIAGSIATASSFHCGASFYIEKMSVAPSI